CACPNESSLPPTVACPPLGSLAPSATTTIPYFLPWSWLYLSSLQTWSRSMGTSGTSTTCALPATPAVSAIQPASRPITSHTMTRLWASAVVCSRSMASVAMLTAVSNPKQTSVPFRSLSMVLGTPTPGTPAWMSALVTDCVSSPPMAMSASSLLALMLATHFSMPPSTLRTLVREVRRMVPPLVMMPSTVSSVSGTVVFSSTPRQPSMNPTNSSPYWLIPLRTTAPITAFSPGQSPPPVNKPTRIA